MTTFHVMAAAGDFADDLRSLGIHDAATARDALVRCLAQLDEDPAAGHDAAQRDQEVRSCYAASSGSSATRSPSPTSRSS